VQTKRGKVEKVEDETVPQLAATIGGLVPNSGDELTDENPQKSTGC
jgi:hypothetical protein